MSLDPKVQAFFAIVEAGSISKAADRLGLTQSALSKLVRRLEDAAGARLLERMQRGVRPTEAGEVFLRRARRAQVEFSHAQEEIAALQSKGIVALKIGCGPIYSFGWIHHPVQQLAARRPDLTFDIITASLRPTRGRLLRGELDAVFGSVDDYGVDDNLECIPIQRVETLVFCRAGHPLLSERRVTPAQLARHAWSIFSQEQTTNEALEAGIRAATGSAPRIRFASSSMSTALLLAAGSDCLVCAPSPLRTYAARAGLRAVDLGHSIRTYQTGCVLRRSSLRYDVMLELVDLISKNAQSWQVE